MTEPTWKDELLQRWAVLNEPQAGRALLHWGPDADPIDVLEDLLRASDFDSLIAAQRLANEIRAELARGREAVEVLRSVQWMQHRCLTCDAWEPTPGQQPNHAPDCRLAKLIGWKP